MRKIIHKLNIMEILKYVDLGKAFESLKETLIETEKTVKGNDEQKYPAAYGKLSAAVEFHIAWNTDTPFGFARKAVEVPEGYPEQPDKILFNQLNY